MASAPIRVRATVTVDIDPEVWALAYGLDAADRAAIRADVKTYIENGAVDHLRDLGLLAGGGAHE